LTSPYDDPYYEPPSDIQGADARAYERKIVELLRERLLPSHGPTIFLRSIELRGERPDTEIVFRYTRTGRAEERTVRAALWQQDWVSDEGGTRDRLSAAMSVGGWLFNAWLADELEDEPQIKAGDGEERDEDRSA
jgi:hypothetical protein